MADFRSAVRRAFGDIFRAADEFLRVGHEVAAMPRTEPLQETVRQLLITVSNSMRSVLILIENGCGTDALKIGRTMFETAVNIHYLDSHPDSLNDYIDFQWVKRKKHYEYLVRTAPVQARQVDPSLEELEAEYARVAPRFTGPSGKVRSRWHKSDHREVAKSIGGEVIYGGVYPFVSSLTHMDILGLITARNASGDIDAVPSDSNLALAVQIAVMSYAMALTAANEVLQTKCDGRIQSAFELFKQASSVRETVAVWNELGRTGGDA